MLSHSGWIRLRKSSFYATISSRLIYIVDTFWKITAGRPYFLALRNGLLANSSPQGDEVKFLRLHGGLEVRNLSSAKNLASIISNEIKYLESDPSLTGFRASKSVRDISLNCVNLLSKEAKISILEFASSPVIAEMFCAYLGFMPRLAGVFLQYNPMSLSDPAGSQRYHKDSDIYKSLNIFLYLHHTDEGNGRLSWYSQVDIPREVTVLSSTSTDMSRDSWDRFRVDSLDVMRTYPEARSRDFDGEAGDFIFLDPVSNYHKGGFCPNAERFLLQISYYTEDMPERAYMNNILDELEIKPHDPMLNNILSHRYSRFLLGGFRSSIPRFPYLPTLINRLASLK